MSMANSLEVRVPYLDHVLVEWVLRLPPSVKRGPAKALLAAAGQDMISQELIRRKKQRFILPFANWLRDDLRDEVDQAPAVPPVELAEAIDPEAGRSIWSQLPLNSVHWTQPWAPYALARWTRSLADVQPKSIGPA